jgi:hypothetical protein
LDATQSRVEKENRQLRKGRWSIIAVEKITWT